MIQNIFLISVGRKCRHTATVGLSILRRRPLCHLRLYWYNSQVDLHARSPVTTLCRFRYAVAQVWTVPCIV